MWAAAKAVSRASSRTSIPRADISAFDIAEAMLRVVPQASTPCCGSMTALPFADDAFDAAYATESLEHAVDIETAVARNVPRRAARRTHRDHRQECRALGQARNSGLGEMVRARANSRSCSRRHCREVSSDFISYWEDVPPDGLFIAWKAVR